MQNSEEYSARWGSRFTPQLSQPSGVRAYTAELLTRAGVNGCVAMCPLSVDMGLLCVMGTCQTLLGRK